MRVVLIKGESAYDALRVFVDELAQAFVARGHSATVIDGLAEPDLHAAFRREAAAGPVGLVFTFNILGDYRDPDGRSLAQVLGAPHVIQYVDYPLTHWVALDRTPRETALLTIDESHVAAVRAAYGPDHFAHLAFSPHAALGAAGPAAADPDAFVAERPIPILFTGTFYAPSKPWWEDQAPVIREMFHRAAETALSVEWIPALDALDAVLADFGLDPAAPEVTPFRKMATHLHEHVRAQRRLDLLQAAAEVGLPVHLYGRGYEPLLSRFRNLTYGGEADMAQTLSLMGRSRLVLNVNANFGMGSHERPLSAMLAGAAAASDASGFYESRFAAGREIALYRWRALHEDLQALAALARDPEALWAMAQAGQRRVAAEHRWDNRIDGILSAADAARAQLRLAA